MKVPLNWLNEIVTLPKDTKLLTDKLTMVGHMLDKKLEIDGQTVLDLELRGNRADCYSIYGIARDVSAIFGSKIKEPETVKLKTVKNIGINLEIKTPLVKRAMITKVKNVKITKSPDWLRKRLELYGMESINNIVDLTNYVMIETGEPMHAFDLAKVSSGLSIRLAKIGDQMTTFKNDVIKLTRDDLVWAMGKEILSVAGAIGEKYHSITDTTADILLEAANYDRANIRRSVYRLNLLTEAGIRHEKELDPNMVATSIARFLYLIKKHNWGEPTYDVYDYYPLKSKSWEIKLDFNQLTTLGGIKLDTKVVVKILKDLGFQILKLTKIDISVLVPTYRTDVTLPEDLAEEILRIYGYDNIPVKTLSLEIPRPITPNYIIQENKLKSSATSVGFNEAITLSFVKTNFSKLNIHSKIGDAKVISLVNPPSPDNRDLRVTLLPNLIELTQKAVYERSVEVRLFELGKVYFKNRTKYTEERRIAFSFYSESANPFSIFKSLVESFFVKAGIEIPSFISTVLLLPLVNSYELEINKKIVGFGGQTQGIYFVEIDLDSILLVNNNYNLNLWPKFPPQIEDITIELPEHTFVGNVRDHIRNFIWESWSLIESVELTSVFQNSYTFRLAYRHPEYTLTDEDTARIRKSIIESVKEKFGGQVKE